MTTKIRFFLFVCAMFFLSGTLNICAQTIDKYAVDGELYFKIKDYVPMNYSIKMGKILPENFPFLNRIKDKYDITSVRNTFWQTTDTKLHRIFQVKFQNKSQVDQFIKDLEANNEIEYAEKAPYLPISYTPDDYGSTAGNNWHLTVIHAEQAWDISHGSAAIKVAVIDNAIDINHPDIAPKVIEAIDLGDNDSDPTPPSTSTIWSHGTHTSGLAVAATDNTTGISSIGFDCSLIAIKAGADADGGQGVSAMYEGITWAADHDANILSMSFGGPSYFQTMQMIVDYAYNKGCVLVAAAGNNGDGAEDPNNVNYVGYPAACNHVIAVGATNGNDVAASFSEYGDWINVMAPGGYENDGGFIDIIQNNSVYSTFANNSYGKMQGTSMSCPITAGLCALMLSVDTNLTPDRLTELLMASCDNIESLQDVAHQGNVGAGRINAFSAVQMVQDSISSVVADFSCSGNFINVGGYVNFTDESVGNITTWDWIFQGGTPSTSNTQNPQNITFDTPGIYPVTLTVSDGSITSTETKLAYITVQQSANSAWIEQASGFSTMYRGCYQLSVVSDSIAWSTAIDGTTGAPVNEFTRTINSGNLWTPGTITVSGSLAPANISAVNDLKAWVSEYPTSGAGGQVYYTDDGGQTWTAQGDASMYNNSASFLNVVHFFNENDGFCMGDPVNNEFEIYYTSDGGQNWTAVAAGDVPDAQSGEMGWTGVYDALNNIAWFGTNLGRIYKTTDKGVTWTVLTPGLSDISKVTFNNENNGIAQEIVYNTSTGAITSLTMKKTNDGGQTWSTITPGSDFWKSDISAVPGVPGKYYSVGSDGAASGSATYGSSYSLDYGATWTAIDTGVQYVSVKFLNDQTGWAGGFSTNSTTGGIYKWDITTFVKPILKTNDVTIYPNPTKGIININSSENIQTIEVMNAIGKRVFMQNIATTNSTLNLNTLGKGLYLVKVVFKDNINIYKVIVQ